MKIGTYTEILIRFIEYQEKRVLNASYRDEKDITADGTIK